MIFIFIKKKAKEKRNKCKLFIFFRMIYSKVQGESERFAASNARGRRGSQPQQKEQSDREKIALDITILKKQYDKLRERQKQAHIILTSAVTKQHQQKHQNNQNPTNVNKLLMGKHAINSKGNRRGPPKGKRMEILIEENIRNNKFLFSLRCNSTGAKSHKRSKDSNK